MHPVSTLYVWERAYRQVYIFFSFTPCSIYIQSNAGMWQTLIPAPASCFTPRYRATHEPQVHKISTSIPLGVKPTVYIHPDNCFSFSLFFFLMLLWLYKCCTCISPWVPIKSLWLDIYVQVKAKIAAFWTNFIFLSCMNWYHIFIYFTYTLLHSIFISQAPRNFCTLDFSTYRTYSCHCLCHCPIFFFPI